MDCLCDSWKVEDINDTNQTEHYIFKDIKPYTRYVVYVQMYVTNMRSGQSAFSPYQYFMTDPGGEYVDLCCYSRLHIGGRTCKCCVIHLPTHFLIVSMFFSTSKFADTT